PRRLRSPVADHCPARDAVLAGATAPPRTDDGRRQDLGALRSVLGPPSRIIRPSALRRAFCGRSDSKAHGLRALPLLRSASRKNLTTRDANRRRALPST